MFGLDCIELVLEGWIMGSHVCWEIKDSNICVKDWSRVIIDVGMCASTGGTAGGHSSCSLQAKCKNFIFKVSRNGTCDGNMTSKKKYTFFYSLLLILAGNQILYQVSLLLRKWKNIFSYNLLQLIADQILKNLYPLQWLLSNTTLTIQSFLCLNVGSRYQTPSR